MGGYMPSTRSERAEMLRAIGLEKPEELFASVPEALRVKKLDLEPGLSELALSREMRGVRRRTASTAPFSAARARTTTTYPPWSAR